MSQTFTTVINWIRAAGHQLRDAPESEAIPEVTDLDELQTFVGNKRNKLWIGSAVNHKQAGILAWIIGDRSAETFKALWSTLKCWQCFFYVTDGLKVYPMFINDGEQIVSKTYMTRVEGENTRLRHYLARLHRKTLCYFTVSGDAEVFITPTAPLFEISSASFTSLIHYSFSNTHQRRKSLCLK